MAHAPRIKNEAILLRKRGIGVPTIAKQLHISKSTASNWLKGVSLSKKAAKELAMRSITGTQKGLARIKAAKEMANKLRSDEMDTLAKEFVAGVGKKHWQIIAALIFWCEGSKRHLGSLKFVNSDPNMIKLFLKALRIGFGIDQNKMKALLHLHEYHIEEKMINFWSGITGINKTRFYRSYIKPNSGKRQREGYKGCIAIYYGEANLARKLDALYHSLSKHLGA